MKLIKKITIPVLIIALFSLTACGGGGGSSAPTGGAANEAPTITMGADKTVDSASVNVEVSGGGSDSDGSIITYSWVQTAGPTVVLNNASAPSASFTAPTVSTETTLTFALTVTDNDGATATGSTNVVINAVVLNVAPTANAGVDQTATSGFIGSIDLDAGQSTDSDGSIVSYSWLQTTGSAVTLTDGDTATPSFPIPSVSANTSFTFTLTVTDNDGATATDDVVVVITNAAPTANAGADRTVESGGTGILLNGSLSSDTDGTVTGYSWSQVSGTTVTLANSATSVASFTAPVVTVDTALTFRLVVTDNNSGTGTDDIVITVSAPALSVTVSTADIKTIKFDWNTIGGASFYRLLVNPDGASGFTLQTDNITATTTNLTLPMHFTDWVNAAYKVEAYDGSGLIISSDAFGITSEMLNMAGYLQADGFGSGDLLGQSVSLSADGTTLAVGAPFEDGSSTGSNGTVDNLMPNSGAVYIFTLSGTAWTQQAYLKASNPGRIIVGTTDDTGDKFGSSVSLSADGSTLAVGAPQEDGGSVGIDGADNDDVNGAGAAYVFRRTGIFWSQQAYLKSDANIRTGDEFGASVSLSGDGNKLVVGATFGPDVSGVQNGVGGVYVFEFNATNWVQQANIIAPNRGIFDRFGISVSLSQDGNTLAVGSPREDSSVTGASGGVDDNASTDAGSAYIFVLNAGVWTNEAYVKASNTGAGDFFGSVVSLSQDGNTLAVSAQSEDGGAVGVDGADPGFDSSESGAVYLYRRSGTAWSQQAYIKASNTGTFDGFGSSLSLSADGNALAVGAISEDGNSRGINGADDNVANDAGAVYVFTFESSAWAQKSYIKANLFNPSSVLSFGKAVSLSADGQTLIVGVPGDAGPALSVPASGAIYLY